MSTTIILGIYVIEGLQSGTIATLQPSMVNKMKDIIRSFGHECYEIPRTTAAGLDEELFACRRLWSSIEACSATISVDCNADIE